MNTDELRAILVEEIENVAPDVNAAAASDNADLREALDLDSMDIFNIVAALSKRFNIDIPDADVPQLTTLRNAVAYLAHCVN